MESSDAANTPDLHVELHVPQVSACARYGRDERARSAPIGATRQTDTLSSSATEQTASVCSEAVWFELGGKRLLLRANSASAGGMHHWDRQACGTIRQWPPASTMAAPMDHLGFEESLDRFFENISRPPDLRLLLAFVRAGLLLHLRTFTISRRWRCGAPSSVVATATDLANFWLLGSDPAPLLRA